jgi:hypothetical protein
MWLCKEFNQCSPDTDEATVTLYARAWVWHMFATMLFSNSMGGRRVLDVHPNPIGLERGGCLQLELSGAGVPILLAL